MSDLVEKVARAMCTDAGFDPEQVMPNNGPRWRYYEPNARAAIRAVAEWLYEDLGTEWTSTGEGLFYKLLKKIKK